MTNPIAVPSPQRHWGSPSNYHLAVFFAEVATPSYPYWDGGRVLFELGSGETCISCAISRAALDELGGERHVGGAAFVRCFLAAQERIEAIARGKLGQVPGASRALAGTLNIWTSDLDDPPPSGGSSESRIPVHRLSA